MTLNDLITDVFRRLEEVQGSPVRWPVQDVIDAINEGFEELSDISEFYERYATIKLRKNATYYDLRSIIPDEILRVTAIYNPTNTTWLGQIDVSQLDTRGTQWEIIPGQPTSWFMRGLWWMGVYPSGPDTNGTLRLYYRALHPPLTDLTQSPDQLPDDYHTCIVDYAMYKLLADDVEITLAMKYWTDFYAVASDLAKKCVPGGRIERARVGGMGRGVSKRI